VSEVTFFGGGSVNISSQTTVADRKEVQLTVCYSYYFSVSSALRFKQRIIILLTNLDRYRYLAPTGVTWLRRPKGQNRPLVFFLLGATAPSGQRPNYSKGL
jgi:hypothetical protein